MICRSCGYEAAGSFRFCPECGASVITSGDSEVRKVVTVLFCDVTGSTSLGESVDPEVLRELLARYYVRTKGIVERHGGTVEKFIGDAVMAVFGVPSVHEDDAVRALRAAAEIRDAFAELGIAGRIGVNSGEVVTGTEERLATGDAVNVAARLEQAAGPGEILAGEETLRLAGTTADVEAVPPLTVKGKRESVPAYRLIAVSNELPPRRLDAPLVGRTEELAALRAGWERVRSDRRCELVTLVGGAGVGKSRLAAELLGDIDGRVVRGRCLPYGEGITYWPVVEVVKQLVGVPVEPRIAAGLAGLAGDEAVTASEEILWAVRKLFESAAAERPLAVLFEDIHWAEERFLDVVEHVALLATGSPILLLCLARPELLDTRQGWAGVLRLEPLSPDESNRLIDNRLRGRELAEAVRAKILRAAGGNPLFVEEMVAILDEAGADVSVPPTIQALLAVRLDQLDPPERGVLERAAVEGEVFHLGAVRALMPEEPGVTTRLTTLARKDLIRRERAQLPGEDGFRFRHILIRDAAYAELPKASRAELHERLAHWLEERGAELVELDELLGYHLEQAYRYRVELGRLTGDGALELAREAGERLRRAGRKALRRADMPAAVSLLLRATELLAETERLDVLPELAIALRESGRLREAEAVLADAIREAAERGNERLRLEASVQHASLQLLSDPEGNADEVLRVAERSIPVLERMGADRALAEAWALVGFVSGSLRGRFAAGEEAFEQARHHAGTGTIGDRRLEAEILVWLTSAYWYGPTPVSDAIRRCEAILDSVAAETAIEAAVLPRLAALQAAGGRFESARTLVEAAQAIQRDLGLRLQEAAVGRFMHGYVELLAGDFAAAERALQPAYETLADMGERSYLAGIAALLAQSLAGQGRYDEAEWFASVCEGSAAPDDVFAQVHLRRARAAVLTSRNEPGAAELIARESVVIAERTDAPDLRGDALLALARVLHSSDREDEATDAATRALRLYDQKGNEVSAQQARLFMAKGAGAARAD